MERRQRGLKSDQVNINFRINNISDKTTGHSHSNAAFSLKSFIQHHRLNSFLSLSDCFELNDTLQIAIRLFAIRVPSKL